MNVRRQHSHAGHAEPWTALLLCSALLGAGCRSLRGDGPKEPKPETPVDEVLVGVPSPEMRERWKEAEAKGELPPLDDVPRPEAGDAVATAGAGTLKESQHRPKRPEIPAGAPPDVQPFSTVPVTEYRGEFAVEKLGPGLLVGRLEKLERDLELHFKLPGPSQELAVAEDARLQLALRDEVLDTTLQRRIVLHEAGKATLVFLAEGSDGTYRTTLDELGLTIAQEPTERTPEHPPVRLSLRDRSVTLAPGERGTLGEGPDALQAIVLESLAQSRAVTVLTEGLSNYVRVLVYRPR